MRYTNIIFDLDGTLLDTIQDLTDAVNYVLSMYQYPTYSILQIQSFVGNGIRKLMERAVPQGKENAQFESIYGAFRSYYTEHCKIATKPYDGIVELLTKLREEGCSLAVVSNKNDAAVKALCADFFSEEIQIAIGQSETTKKKPAPDTVYNAMQEMPQGNTLYVGDSEVDKMTADNAGLDCVLVSWGFRERQQLCDMNPVAVIDAPLELLNLI